MLDTIYVETSISHHPRTMSILARYPKARVIPCANYRAVFNRRAQNFRVQKARPALILAKKDPPYLHVVPGEQHLGAKHNFYFSHLLNCPFDCRYCFLQGMFSSANYVLFVNYEDFITEISTRCLAQNEPIHLFSGYDCDSLALEPLTGFAENFIDAIARYDTALLELRTKSTQIRALLARDPHDRCVVAMSLAPQFIAERIEHGAPNLSERLSAIRKLQAHGWPVGLRFDPLIAISDPIPMYRDFFTQVFSNIDVARVHSVTLGKFRLPREFGKRMFKLFPEEPLFAGPLTDVDGTFVFGSEKDRDLLTFSVETLHERVGAEKVFVQH